MKELSLEQRSEEWFEVRIWKITWTTLKDVMASNNLHLIDKLLAEILSNKAKEFYPSREMERWIDTEPKAIKEYEKVTGRKVKEVWFCISDEFDFLWHSPDWLVEVDWVYRRWVEIKCWDSATHVRYIRTNKVDKKYWYQVLNYFLVIETLKEVDFVSYDDRILAKPINIVTVRREDIGKELYEIREELKKFKKKLDKYHKQIIF